MAFVAVLWSGLAGAGPTLLVTASGDCRDGELLSDAKLLSDALRARQGPAVMGEDQVAQKLGGESTRSLAELLRQLDSAKTDFSHGDPVKAEVRLEEVLQEAPLLPPSAEAWPLEAQAQLLEGLVQWNRGKGAALDEAFRRVARNDPDWKLDADFFSPPLHERYQRIRAELARAKRASVSVRSTPAGADVFVDGRKWGQTPLRLELLPGAYQLVLAKGEQVSLAHAVQAKGEGQLLVDLTFEGAVHGRRLPCLADEGDEQGRLARAVKLASVVGVDQAVVARLERQAAGPSWFAAAMVQTATAQKVREGGLKVERQGKAPDGLDELADFLVTGQPSHKVLTEPPKVVAAAAEPASSPPAAPVAATAPPPAATLEAPTATVRTGRSTAGYVLMASGVLFGGGAAGFGVASNKAWSDFNTYYGSSAPGPGQTSLAQSAQTRAQTDGILMWTGVGLAAACLGAGAYLWLTDSPHASVALAPAAGGAVLAGTFR